MHTGIEGIVLMRKRAEKALAQAKIDLKSAKLLESETRSLLTRKIIREKAALKEKKAEDAIQKKINNASRSRALTPVKDNPRIRIVKTPEPKNAPRDFLGINNPMIRRRDDGFFEIKGTLKNKPRALPRPKAINAKYSVKK